jgi:ribosomal protein S18 acetylase RimI-like enzyme
MAHTTEIKNMDQVDQKLNNRLPQPIEIRKPTYLDKDRVREIIQVHHLKLMGLTPRPGEFDKFWSAITSDGECRGLVLLKNSVVAGLTFYNTKNNMLKLITFDPAYQGHGLGSTLLVATLAKLPNGTTLDVKKNNPNIKYLPTYYKKFGFKVIEDTYEKIIMKR